MLEQQIYSIESANINQETLAAMKNAGKAMKEIHGKVTMEDVDTTMYVLSHSVLSPLPFSPYSIILFIESGALIRARRPRREQLREQHELTQEIGNAITSMPISDAVDEDELESELEAMEQESLDTKLLKTGTVPVADRLPPSANGPLKSNKQKQHVEEEDEEEELRKLQAEMAM